MAGRSSGCIAASCSPTRISRRVPIGPPAGKSIPKIACCGIPTGSGWTWRRCATRCWRCQHGSIRALRPAGRHGGRRTVPSPHGLRTCRSGPFARLFPVIRFCESGPVGRTAAADDGATAGPVCDEFAVRDRAGPLAGPSPRNCGQIVAQSTGSTLCYQIVFSRRPKRRKPNWPSSSSKRPVPIKTIRRSTPGSSTRRYCSCRMSFCLWTESRTRLP